MIRLDRLRRHEVVQWTLAHMGVAWGLIEVVSLFGDQVGWPVTLMRSTAVLLSSGLLAVPIVAWYHGEKGAQRVSAPELMMLEGVLLLAGGAVAYVIRTAPATPAPTTTPGSRARAGWASSRKRSAPPPGTRRSPLRPARSRRSPRSHAWRRPCPR